MAIRWFEFMAELHARWPALRCKLAKDSPDLLPPGCVPRTKLQKDIALAKQQSLAANYDELVTYEARKVEFVVQWAQKLARQRKKTGHIVVNPPPTWNEVWGREPSEIGSDSQGECSDNSEEDKDEGRDHGDERKSNTGRNNNDKGQDRHCGTQDEVDGGSKSGNVCSRTDCSHCSETLQTHPYGFTNHIYAAERLQSNNRVPLTAPTAVDMKTVKAILTDRNVRFTKVCHETRCPLHDNGPVWLVQQADLTKELATMDNHDPRRPVLVGKLREVKAEVRRYELHL
jgi:hypothetical protein